MFKRLIDRFTAWSQFRRVRAWYRKYERYLLPAALLIGFVGDTIAVRTINLDIIRFILLGHLVLAGAGIIIVNIPQDQVKRQVFRYVQLFMPLAIQYAFGALFSIFIVLYSHSGALTASWPFILVLVILFTGTELFKKQYERRIIQMSALSFALLSYMILFVPYVLREVGTFMFLLSGVVTVLALYGYLEIAVRVSEKIHTDREAITRGIGMVFIAVYAFYFLNMIPPFPLSVRDAGVYYNVERTPEGYQVVDEEQRWHESLFPFETVRFSSGNERLYVYSAVFAPTELTADIAHEWYYHDPDNGWTRRSRVTFPIVGGRDTGYRGYSYHSNMTPGWWRVSIETERGRVIGNVRFRVTETNDTLQTVEELRP